MSTLPQPPGPTMLLTCRACSRAERFPPTAVRWFVQTGWPQCCGRTMAILDEEPQPIIVTRPPAQPPKT